MVSLTTRLFCWISVLTVATAFRSAFIPSSTHRISMKTRSPVTITATNNAPQRRPSGNVPITTIGTTATFARLVSVEDDDDDESLPKKGGLTLPRRSFWSHWKKTLVPVVASILLIPTVSHAASIDWSGTYASFQQTGFYQAFSLVFLSELGDKTFFIAGLLAMKTSRWISFVGSMGALAAMTIISVLIGQIFHNVPSGLEAGLPLDDIAAVLAFAFFGIKTLQEALDDDKTSAVGKMEEEFAEAEEVVEETNYVDRGLIGRIAGIFGLVFAAEFGDRSFLSTIALSAAQNPVFVGIGAIAAHAVATGIAVASGSVVSKYLSEKVIGVIGGSLFLVFAVTTALGIF